MQNLPRIQRISARSFFATALAAALILVGLQSLAEAHSGRDDRRAVAHAARTTWSPWFWWARGDVDRDGLTNWTEITRTGTDWRRADTDGDGFGDKAEIVAGSDPRDGADTPDRTPPPEVPPTEPTPETEPPAPEEPPAEPPEPEEPPVDPPSPPVDPPVWPPEPSCATGATNATTASAVTSAVAAQKSVCITGAVGNLSFSGLGDRSGVVISTNGGSIGHIEINGTAGLTLRSARLRSVTLRNSNRTVIEGSTIGGTAANRVLDQLIFMPDKSTDVVIRGNDIGWTKADNSGNTGYGCRCYGQTDRLQFVGNVVHDIAADGFQGTNGADILIDRNKIGPVGANPGSSEHSDNIQIVGNGPNLRITNNWIYQQGYYDGNVTNNAGSTYIHGGTSNSLLYENNLIQTARGRTEICGLGTGGTSRSNITVRRNTWVDGGQTYSGFPGFEWDCDSGSGNKVERNIAIDPDGGFAQNGSSAAAAFTANLWGKPTLVTLDAQGNCTSANCNPAGEEAIGYRKPTGVGW
jgi:hypothetical protein